MKGLATITLLLLTTNVGLAQIRVTARQWEPQARQLAIDATGDTSLALPSGIEPAPAVGDTLLVDVATGAASGWKYDYAYGPFGSQGQRRVAHVTLVSGQEPVVVVPTYPSYPGSSDNLYPLQSGWLDSDQFLQLAMPEEFSGGWSIAGILDTYEDAAVTELRAYGGDKGPQNGYVGLWRVVMESKVCQVRMRVELWATRGLFSGGSWPGGSRPLGSCIPVATEGDALLPPFSLGANFPNPFTQGTTVPFTLSESADVQLEVLDVLGRVVAVIAKGRFAAGTHTATWESGGRASGVYLYRLKAGTEEIGRRMMLIRH